MPKTETLHFTISGEFITDLVRQWFWLEHKPYNICEQLIFDCMVSDDIDDEFRRQTAVAIIEGRKRFVGENCFILVDDPDGPVRPLSDALNIMQRERDVARIKDQMRLTPAKFVDPYSTYKSLKSFLEIYNEDAPLAQVQSFFACKRNTWSHTEEPNFDDRYYTPTMMGLWLLYEPELVEKSLHDNKFSLGSDDFWDFIYEETKDRVGFQDRNQRYLAQSRLKKRNQEHLASTLQEAKEAGKEFLKTLEPLRDKKGRKNAQSFAAGVALQKIDDRPSDDALVYTTVPDDMINWDGLIRPNGDFFSCPFGGHLTKAHYIIMTHPDWFGFKEGEEPDIPWDDSLDYLIDKMGWCATRSQMYSSMYYITVPSQGSIKKPTKAQKDRIWEAIVKFDATPDNMYVLED